MKQRAHRQYRDEALLWLKNAQQIAEEMTARNASEQEWKEFRKRFREAVAQAKNVNVDSLI